MSDDGFLAGVYRTSGILWLIGVGVFAAFRSWSGVAGWTVGSAVSVGVVRSLEVVIRRSFVPGAAKPKRDLSRLSLAKLPVVILVLIGIVLLGGRDLALVGAFCAGVVLVQSAIVLNTLRSLVVGGPSN